MVLVGDDPASQVYVRNKGRQTREAGLLSQEYKLGGSVSEEELLELIRQLNESAAIHGILVQLPLPEHICEQRILRAIDPMKDVDGFHPSNVGGLASGDPSAVAPCTPKGCVFLLKDQFQGDLSGQHAVVVGRSNIVGKPMAQLLLQENCTVTIAHSQTKDLPVVCRSADILVVAVGKPEIIRGECIKPGAVVIDVGINRVQRVGDEKTKLVGDVAFEECAEVARAITPVPGGVGPMTIATLLHNTVQAACNQMQVQCELTQ